MLFRADFGSNALGSRTCFQSLAVPPAMMRSSVLVGRSLVRRSIAPSGPHRCAPIAAAAPGQVAQAFVEHALIVDNPVSIGAYWTTLGLVGNSSIFMAQDFIDAHFTPTEMLSTAGALAGSNMGCLVAAVGGAELVRRLASLAFPSLRIPVGSKAEESSAYDDVKRKLLRFRILGLVLGGTLGFFPLLWPDDPHFLEGQAFGTKTVPNELLFCEEHFPSALSGPNFEKHVFNALAARGWTAKNTLVAYAGCPDEVNSDDRTDLLNVMKQRWRKLFCLGGLAGLAFGGGTGWKAFSTHTPTDGRILVLWSRLRRVPLGRGNRAPESRGHAAEHADEAPQALPGEDHGEPRAVALARLREL